MILIILMIEIMEDFLMMVMNLLLIVGSIVLNVCGKIINFMVVVLFILSEWVVFS